MKCPFCNAPDTKVVNSRPTDGGDSIRRRRECEKCGNRFTTFETTEKALQTVVKRDGSRVPYSRERMLRGIEKACKKRPVTTEQIDEIMVHVERVAFRENRRETSTEQIGQLILECLLEIDKVAYLRFASVYHQFNDLAAFRKEIDKLLDQ